MNVVKAGRVNGTKGTCTAIKAKLCVHQQRMVDYHDNEKVQPSGNLVCREWGAVIPDLARVLGEGQFSFIFVF